MAEDRHVVRLRRPIQDGEERVIEELRFRPGRFEDLKGLSFQVGSGAVPVAFDDLMKIAGRLCGEPSYIIGKLEGDDLAEVGRIALVFYLRFLGGGETPSPSSPTG